MHSIGDTDEMPREGPVRFDGVLLGPDRPEHTSRITGVATR